MGGPAARRATRTSQSVLSAETVKPSTRNSETETPTSRLQRVGVAECQAVTRVPVSNALSLDARVWSKVAAAAD